ncbi:Protein draper [Eumeta japonica]|uniref:Protein draper n=1 Tax=Eumeta variegata TaxID=151549 RepID=A0A4C1WPP5_EUMVA|nr:Protein draper [Eumeta japonica]
MPKFKSIGPIVWESLDRVSQCPVGRWGKDCGHTCDCANRAGCHHITGQCLCEPGFMGDKCLDTCPVGFYGVNCLSKCRCDHDSTCSVKDGGCTCRPGWRGEQCEERACPDGLWGPQCNKTCECDPANTDMCDPWTGACDCSAGWDGETCDRQCRFLRYGKGCSMPCRCEHNGLCSPVNGSCQCAPGYRGKNCEEKCPYPYYGVNCSDTCDCYNNSTCSHETGQCECAPGFDGLKCDRPCDGKTYGLKCSLYCNCENNSSCNPIDASVAPAAGVLASSLICLDAFILLHPRQSCSVLWVSACVDRDLMALVAKTDVVPAGSDRTARTSAHVPKIRSDATPSQDNVFVQVLGERGVRCETQCPEGYYGDQCSESCPCSNNSSCDASTGRCVCAAGWTGERCEQPCPSGYYGAGCTQKCLDSPQENNACDPVSGKFTCPDGYTGVRCEYPCPLGTYGHLCKEKCDCKNGADCNHITGKCQCLPGWRGEQCSVACGEGWWGAYCTQPCRCDRGAQCRPNDGKCRCPPGYMGDYCTQFCPEGFFGDHCMKPCNCPVEPGNWVCHPVKGCVCHRGYIGENCDVHARDAIVIDQDPESSRNGLTAIMVVMALLCAAAAILVLLYYRKRVRNLKLEIAHVHYTAQPSSQPEQHFDNPVYSYQNGSQDDATTLLNNSTLIRNNLAAASKLSNTHMEKLRMHSSGSSDSYDPLSSLKNKDADATNPNLYHCIDDENKLDHVYDEIKHKEGYEMEYDHLNYTPPSSKWKPHYQRMANGLTAAAATAAAPQPAPRVLPPALDTAAPPIPPLPKLSNGTTATPSATTDDDRCSQSDDDNEHN